MHKDLRWTHEGVSSNHLDIYWLHTSIPASQHICSDFNCQHTSWGYQNNSGSGNCLVQWANLNDLSLLYDPKEPCSFHSGRWNTGTNPDLAFASCTKGHLLDRRVLGKFPKSKHQPSLILTQQLIQPILSKPVQCWNFRKANWEQYCLITEETIKDLPPPDSNDVNQTYQAFCELLISVAKKTIPHRYRKTYIPCWDEECNSLYHAFQHGALETETKFASEKLLSSLDQKRQFRWAEAVDNINFRHSSHKAWETVNQLTGQSAPPCKCPISANSIVSELVKNGVFKNKDHEFTRLMVREVSDRWRAQSVDLDLSGDLQPRDYTQPSNNSKLAKLQGQIIYAQSYTPCQWQAESLVHDFLSSCMCHLGIPKIWRRAIVIAIPKPNKLLNKAKSYCPISLLCVPFKIFECLIHSPIELVIDS